MTRAFEAKQAKRLAVPLLAGIMGPSGGGKTYSAHRLATGIRKVSGGKVYCVDTENKRALHYADKFDFQHVDMGPPFGSLDYLAAVKYCEAQGASVVIIDSMSHEHEGEGGYLDLHDKELTRLTKGDDSKRGQMNFLAWAKPSQQRQQMIQGLLRVNCSVICCFRAKEKIKLVKNAQGRQEPVEIGWMPIAGEALLYEMTLNCLLPPRADGVPQWTSEFSGEKLMMKLPEQFRHLFTGGTPLNEFMGEQLATWAAGGSKPPPAADVAAVPAELKELHSLVLEAAKIGRLQFEAAWKRLTKAERGSLGDYVLTIYKPAVEAAEAKRVSA
jgi:hypothetical protein